MAVNPHRYRRGVTLIWVALVAIVLIGFMGLATDTAFCLWTARQLQTAADAAALAGAQRVRTDVAAAMQAAIDIAQDNRAGGASVLLASNSGNAVNGDVVVGVFDSNALTFTPTLTAPNAVRVNARRTSSSLGGPVSLLFGPIFGINTVDISRSAVALAGGVGAGLVVLDRSAPGSLSGQGNASVTVINGAIQVNSSSSSAISGNGNVTFSAQEVNVGGNVSGNGNIQINGQLNTGAPPVNDPLVALPPPTFNPASDKGTINRPGTFQPGYYSGGISVGGSSTVTLAPGIYILGGAGINLSGNASLNAQGVMLYVTGTGSVNLGGTGSVVITPPDPNVNNFPGASTYAGTSIFQDRSDSTAGTLNGNANMNITGTVYVSAATLTLVGNGGTVGNQIIADQLRVTGNANITIPYNGSNQLPRFQSWLVQ